MHKFKKNHKQSSVKNGRLFQNTEHGYMDSYLSVSFYLNLLVSEMYEMQCII